MMNTVGWVSTSLVIWAGVLVSGAEVLSEKFSGEVVSGSGFVQGDVYAGQTKVVRWSISKKTDCDGWSSRVWTGENDFLVVEPAKPTTLPMSGDFLPYNIPTKIPELAPIGKLSMEVRGEYSCSGSKRTFRLGPVEMNVVSTPDELRTD